jgi:hypothetical protein
MCNKSKQKPPDFGIKVRDNRPNQYKVSVDVDQTLSFNPINIINDKKNYK